LNIFTEETKFSLANETVCGTFMPRVLHAMLQGYGMASLEMLRNRNSLDSENIEGFGMDQISSDRQVYCVSTP